MVGEPLTAAEHAQWLRPSEALERFHPTGELVERKRAIIRRLAKGEIRAGGKGDHGLVVILAGRWRDWHVEDAALWTIGDVSFSRGGEHGGSMLFIDGQRYDRPDPYEAIGFVNVRFDLAFAESEFDPPLAKVSAPIRSGRPSATWWEDLWIEIARQLYAGDLDHQSQAAIEKSMHNWIATQGHEAGETTVRDRARRLFQALNREVGN